MQKSLTAILCCPECHGSLEWQITEESRDGEIDSASARCKNCRRKFLVKEGVGIFTIEGEKDSWKEIYQELQKFMQTDEGEEFLRIPFSDLKPADRLFQSYMLEITGDYKDAQRAEDSAMKDIYSREYNECWERQASYIATILASRSAESIIMDLASGRCSFVKFIAPQTRSHILVTDISPTILERDKKILELSSVIDRVDLLAFDMRKMPFRDSSLPIVTTNLGIQNVSDRMGQVDGVIGELKRVLGERFLGIFDFFSPEDTGNGGRISELGLSWSLYKEGLLGRFKKAGLEVDVANVCAGRNDPTPTGELIKGAAIDALPIESTVTEWCTIEARVK